MALKRALDPDGGGAAATTQDLVLPRMRGTATGTFFIGTTLLGLALGPYLAGRVSTLSGSLSVGMLSLLLSVPITLAAGIAAYRLVPAAEAVFPMRPLAGGGAVHHGPAATAAFRRDRRLVAHEARSPALPLTAISLRELGRRRRVRQLHLDAAADRDAHL